MLIVTVISALACAVLVVAEARGWRALRVISKIIASLAFLACGLAAAARGAGHAGVLRGLAEPDLAILGGLAFGVIGDIALLGRGKPAFAAGLGAFLIGHLLYLLAALQRGADAGWLTPWDIVPIGVGVGALVRLWPRLGHLRFAVAGYVAAIIAMMIAAIALARGTPRFTVGAALFFASDLSVARDRFGAKSFVNKAWGLPAYYAGQLLIAWSLA